MVGGRVAIGATTTEDETMSRFAHEHPDDYDSLIDAYRDEADTRRKESREGSAALRSDPVRSEGASRHCPLCGSHDYTITGANRVVSIGIDWGARFKCGNCGASYR